MLLADTSVWIEYLNDARTLAARNLRAAVSTGPTDVMLTEPVVMELLIGAKEGRELAKLEEWLSEAPKLLVQPDADFRQAANIFRAVRRIGYTPRSHTDCLIAAVAIRTGASLAHRDNDFEVIAAVIDLPTLDWRG